MGVTTEFAIDATTFAPHPIDDASITFEPTTITGQVTNTVQRDAQYTLSFTTPVALEADGCFLKLVFPDDFTIKEDTFTAFAASNTMGNRVRPLSGQGD
jgi:hypothetical protein